MNRIKFYALPLSTLGCNSYHASLVATSGLIITDGVCDTRPHNKCKAIDRRGFTLIELSIVLVIIGLLIGGVLVGRDLIASAEIRAQISQIEKYNTAINTFKLKYGYLPGDIPEPHASSFGFMARGSYAGQGDGNETLEGFTANAINSNLGTSQSGENLMIWADLSKVNLIDAKLDTITSTGFPTNTTNIPLYLPKAKIRDNYLYIYTYNKITYYALTARSGTSFGGIDPSYIGISEGLTVTEASKIDNKIDDGLPMLGKVNVQFGITIFSTAQAQWRYGKSSSVGSYINGLLIPTSMGLAGNSNSCFDNNNIPNATYQYSVTQNGGNGVNCILSIKVR